MLWQVFLGWASTKQRMKRLAQGHNAVLPVRLNLQPLDLESRTLPLSHHAPQVNGLKGDKASRWLHFWKLFFLFLNQNMCCGYSKEPSQWDGSFEHRKHMTKLMGKEINAILGAQTILIWTYGDLLLQSWYKLPSVIWVYTSFVFV